MILFAATFWWMRGDKTMKDLFILKKCLTFSYSLEDNVLVLLGVRFADNDQQVAAC